MKKTKETTEKIFLYNDENMYQTYKKNEDAMFKALDNIEGYYKQCMASAPPNYKHLLDNVPHTFVHNYWTAYCMSYLPGHLDKEAIFEQQTTITVFLLENMQTRFFMYYNKLGEFKPTINASGVVSNLKKEDFNRYLDPAKKEHYKALKNFIDSAKTLEKYGAKGGINLIRYSPDLLLNGLEVEINYNNFTEKN